MSRSPGEGSRRRPLAIVLGVTALAVAAGGGIAAASVLGSDSGCEGGRTLRVTAAPEIAPVISETAGALGSGDACVEVTVAGADPATVVAGLADGTIRPPDVWVPDSSLWLTRADVDALAHVGDAEPVATSPLVFAVTGETAGRLAGGGPRPEFTDLVETTGDGRPFTLRMSAERLSPERVGAIVALTDATTDLPESRAALAGLLRAVEATEEPSADLLPALADDAALPVPERSVWAANQDGSELDAVYPGAVTFDYPYAVLATGGATRDLADQLFGLLRSERGQRAAQEAGFRTASGAPGEALEDAAGVDASRDVAARPLGTRSLRRAERSLAAANQDARLLAVVDVSGSMTWGLAGKGTPGPSRMRIATGAAGEGLGLYPDSTEVGLWVFPDPAVRQRGHRQVAPVRPVGDGERRGRLAGQLAGIRAVPDGATPLYAAVVDAVEAMHASWEPGKVNAIVLLSDGEDTGGGPPLAQVVSRLQSVRSSDRPVPVITIAFGPDSNADALARISAASGGTAYRAAAGEDIRRIFLDAVGHRECRPHCPTDG